MSTTSTLLAPFRRVRTRRSVVALAAVVTAAAALAAGGLVAVHLDGAPVRAVASLGSGLPAVDEGFHVPEEWEWVWVADGPDAPVFTITETYDADHDRYDANVDSATIGVHAMRGWSGEQEVSLVVRVTSWEGGTPRTVAQRQVQQVLDDATGTYFFPGGHEYSIRLGAEAARLSVDYELTWSSGIYALNQLAVKNDNGSGRSVCATQGLTCAPDGEEAVLVADRRSASPIQSGFAASGLSPTPVFTSTDVYEPVGDRYDVRTKAASIGVRRWRDEPGVQRLVAVEKLVRTEPDGSTSVVEEFTETVELSASVPTARLLGNEIVAPVPVEATLRWEQLVTWYRADGSVIGARRTTPGVDGYTWSTCEPKDLQCLHGSRWIDRRRTAVDVRTAAAEGAPGPVVGYDGPGSTAKPVLAVHLEDAPLRWDGTGVGFSSPGLVVGASPASAGLQEVTVGVRVQHRGAGEAAWSAPAYTSTTSAVLPKGFVHLGELHEAFATLPWNAEHRIEFRVTWRDPRTGAVLASELVYAAPGAVTCQGTWLKVCTVQSDGQVTF